MKMMKYKLLVLDIDGTLVGKNTIVSAENKAALKRATARGVTVSLCTGRAPQGAAIVLNQLGLDGYHTCFDGALVINPESRGTIFSQVLDQKALKQAIEWSRTNNLDLDLYTATEYFAERETWSTTVHRQFFSVAPVIKRFEDINGKENIIKIGTVARSKDDSQKVTEFQNQFKGKFNFTRVRTPAYPEVDFINVVSTLVSKGRAVLELAAYLKIEQREIIAIGDGPNDISLLETAGFAIAMPHAPDELKAIADYITTDVEENGVAEATNKYLF